MLRDSLRSPDPTTILVTGTMVAIMAIDPDRHEDPAGAQLMESFLDVDIAEITAVLHLAAALTEDDLLRTRIQRELAGRRQPVPPMVRDLAAARAVEAWFMTDDLGDGDNIMLGLRWPGGEVATFVVYIDHNLGTYPQVQVLNSDGWQMQVVPQGATPGVGEYKLQHVTVNRFVVTHNSAIDGFVIFIG